MIKRDASLLIFSDEYKNKMRFIAGPRQSGKTTLALNFLKEKNLERLYYNWDKRDIRTRYYENSYFYYDDILSIPAKCRKWICFDEIHKMPKWKNILKDIYDTDHKKATFIVTGSARLDLFRKSGDSLTGRYYLFHLFPITLHELLQNYNLNSTSYKKPPVRAVDFIESSLSDISYHHESLMQLLKFSGFPEPIVDSKENLLVMWKNNYMDTIIHDDIRNTINVKNLENIAKLATLLPSKIGSPLSVNSLTRDIEVSYPAVKNYLYALELCYVIFKIPPYSHKISRAVRKEQKIYFFDWTRNISDAARFENYVAFELYNLVMFWKDHGFGNYSLNYVRHRDGRETDFLITRNEEPWLLIETKLNEISVDKHHLSHAEQLGSIPFVQLVFCNNIAKKIGKNAFVVSASRFFST